jgi:DNA-binding response OmpR family regulator
VGTDVASQQTVLVIEDDPTIAEFLATALEDEGYRAVTAANGLAGLELMRQQRPAAVLLDLMLPVMDGWHVLRECRADPALRNLPIIVLTAARGAAQDRELASVVVMSKPFSLEMLLVLIEDAISSAETAAHSDVGPTSESGPLKQPAAC